MNLKTNSVIILALCLLLTSCVNKKKKESTAVGNQAIAAEGTWGGVVREADGRVVYRMVALNVKGFEMMSKSIGVQNEMLIDRGAVKLTGDSVIVGGATYCVSKDMLYNRSDTLVRLNKDTRLPMPVRQLYMIATADGATATLERYTQGGRQIAIFGFGGKTYRLKLNEQNTQVNEYTDGKNHLEMEIVDPAPEPETTPVFDNGKTKCEFRIASPTNNLYASKNAPQYDVLYFTGEEKNFVMLLAPQTKDCHILPQTEAWSKGAVYSDEKTKWKINGETAELFKFNTYLCLKYKIINAKHNL